MRALSPAALLWACSTIAPSTPGGPTGTVTVSVHASCPGCRIDRTRVLLDGVEVSGGTAITPRACGMPTSAQEHALRVVVDLSAPCGLFDSPRSSVRLESGYAVTIDGAAVVDVEIIDEGGATSAFGAHLDARWVARGVEPAGQDGQPVPVGCLSLDAQRCAECRVLARRDTAVRKRDLVETSCLNEKLATIRSAMGRADSGDPRATATILGAQREASICLGQGPALLGHTEVLETRDCGEAPREPHRYIVPLPRLPGDAEVDAEVGSRPSAALAPIAVPSPESSASSAPGKGDHSSSGRPLPSQRSRSVLRVQ